MRRILFSLALFGLLAFAVGGASADSSAIDFESYSLGNINGQNGWSKTGPYDVEVADVSGFANAAGFGFGDQSLRISNAYTSGSFGDMAFAPQLANESGEGELGYFEAGFDIGAALSTQQTGLSISVSPDGGDGSRMSYLRFVDQSDGIHVYFDDTTDAGPLGTTADFNETDIATLSRTAAHSVLFKIWFLDGPANDVVQIYLDGALEITGTTWEDYYRYDPEQSTNGNIVPDVDTLLFRTGGTAALGNLGKGYLVDNVSFGSDAVTQCTTTCYVDAVNGTDAAGGTSVSDAKKTIQAAIDTVSSNGTVRVLPGDYDETATNRFVNGTNGPHQFGLFFDAAKPGVTVMGVTSGDVAITDPTSTQATVTTNATNNFGYSGVFVDAANTTIQGLEIGGNAAGDEKTIEVEADNFSLKYSKTSIPGGFGGSVYINDWSEAGDVVKAYHILNNEFTDGTSVDISSGPGSTGPLSGREIKNNHFDLNDNGFNGVSFNGSGTSVPWFENTVGGAQISGNTFENSTQYIRSRGTVVSAEFAWGDWFNDNTFETAVMTGPDPANDSLTGDAYDCGFGPGSCPNRMRIGATIQGEVNRAAANDIVLVKAGSYAENVNIATSGLDLRGAKYGVAVGGRTYGAAAESTVTGVATSGNPATFTLNAANVSLDGFSIRNNAPTSGAAMGVTVNSTGSGSSISHNIIDNVTTPDTGGNGTAQGVYLSSGPDNVTVEDNRINNISSFRSAKAVLVGDSNSSNPSNNAVIRNNVMTNITSTSRGAYGVQLNNGSNGASANLSSNTGLSITGNTISTLSSPGWVHAIGLEADTPSALVQKNVISGITDSFDAGSGLDQSAVWLEDNASYASVNIDRNSLAVGNDRYGVANTVSSPAGTADAECNWWGDADGPSSTSGSDTAGNVDAIPWLLSSNLDGDCTAIAVDDAAADANGAEGSALHAEGSFTGDVASIDADETVGTFMDNGDGTWDWDYTPTDQFSTVTITVTATGENGSTASDAFDASASNANPTASALSAPASQMYGTNFNISLTSPTDVSSVDAGSLRYAFDCGTGYTAANYASASSTNLKSCPAPLQTSAGQSIAVKGKVFDKDGGSNEYTASVEVLQPEISLTPTSHNYGTVLTGSTTASTTYTVKNEGTANLSISGVGLAGTNPGHFGIDTNNCDLDVLAPDETCTVLVFFHPTTGGAKTARLEVDSDDPNTPTVDSDLSGSGGSASNGIITIKLDARPDGAQAFNFSGGLGAFSLTDNATPANTIQFSKPAGQYTVTIANPGGWTLKSLSCTTSETVNKSKRKVTINLSSGENTTCTFTETQRLPDASIALTSGGTYNGVGIYAGSAQPNQTQNRIIPIGQTQSFFVHLKNNSMDTDSLKIWSVLTGSDKFAVKFFRGTQDITTKVNAGTYNFSLASGAQITIEIRVRTLTGATATGMRNIDLNFKSKTSTAKDVVRAHVSRQ